MSDQMPAERVAPREDVLPPLPPTIPSGRAVLGGKCPHSAPDECDACNGQRVEERERWRAQRDVARSRVPLSREQLWDLYLANRQVLRSAS